MCSEAWSVSVGGDSAAGLHLSLLFPPFHIGHITQGCKMHEEALELPLRGEGSRGWGWGGGWEGDMGKSGWEVIKQREVERQGLVSAMSTPSVSVCVVL